MVMLLWIQMDASEDTIEDRLGLFNFITIFWSLNAAYEVIFSFPAEQHVLNNDRAAGTYRLSAYYFGKTVVELTVDLVLPLTIAVCIYFAVGMNADIRAFGLFLVVVALFIIQAQGVGIALWTTLMNIRHAHVGVRLSSCSHWSPPAIPSTPI